MLGADVFVFPDFGDAFIRSVKANALYAKQVTSSVLVLTTEAELWASELLKRADNGLNSSKSPPEGAIRALTYLKFILSAQSIVRPLVEAGILRAPDPASLRSAIGRMEQARLSRESSSTVDTFGALDQFEKADPALINLVRKAHREISPNLLDLIPLLLMLEESEMPTFEEFNKRPILSAALMLRACGDEKLDNVNVPVFGVTMAIWAAALESSGIPVVWSQPVLRDSLWAVHRILSSRHSPDRDVGIIDAEGILGTTIVETYLPAVHDLPIEDILSFRQKYEAELDAFRSGIGELAAGIDVTQSPATIERQSRDMVRLRVSPAVRDLRARLKIARLEALQKVGRSWQSLASLTFSSTIAALAGAPLDVSAFAGLAGTLGQALLEGAIERRKIAHSCQWSALVRFEKIM